MWKIKIPRYGLSSISGAVFKRSSRGHTYFSIPIGSKCVRVAENQEKKIEEKHCKCIVIFKVQPRLEGLKEQVFVDHLTGHKPYISESYPRKAKNCANTGKFSYIRCRFPVCVRVCVCVCAKERVQI